MLGHYRTLQRLTEIALVLARHNVEPFAERSFPFRVLTWMTGINAETRRLRRENPPEVRLRKSLEALGPTFIKFGQGLSTRMDALPEVVGLEMKKLQDAVPTFSFDVVLKTIQKELGGPLEKFFREFDREPVASASIAQVHRATTVDGREVAVKVLRPDVEAVVDLDIRMLTTLAGLIEEHIPEWRRLRATQVVAEFASSIRSEMNFQLEGSRAQKFRENFKNDPELYVPAVVWPLTTQRVLTLDWIDGIPIDELVAHPDPKLDSVVISKNIISSFFKQVFRDGFFHADQHPGNIFVLANGTIAILDFGIIGRVSMQDRILLAKLLQGFLQRDYRQVARVHLEAGYVPRHTDLDAFEEACRMIAEPIFGQPLKEISIARLLAQLFKVTEQYEMPVQPQLLLLQKTMVVLEGVGREINPNLNMWSLSEPLIRTWMMEHLGPVGQARNAREQFSKVSGSVAMLPELLMTGAERLARDRLRVRIHPESLQRLERGVYQGFRRQTAAITGGSLFVGGALLALADKSVLWYMPPLIIAGFYFLKSWGRAVQ